MTWDEWITLPNREKDEAVQTVRGQIRVPTLIVAVIVANPAPFAEDPMRKELAKAIVDVPPPARSEAVKYRQWGEGLEPEVVMQIPTLRRRAGFPATPLLIKIVFR